MFGWKKDKEDKRDLKFSIPNIDLPSKVNLVKDFTLVYNQGNSNSCVAHGVALSYMIQLIKQKTTFFKPSRLYIYYNARYIDNPKLIEDEGTYIRSGIKSVVQYGSCDESIWKFDLTKVNVKPQNVRYNPYTIGIKNQVIKYERVSKSRLAVKTALALGSTVIFGLYIHSNFTSENLKNNNWIFQNPSDNDYFLGGHCVTIVGYDDSTQLFKARNSWSNNWGDKGDFYIPYSVMEGDLVDDLWKISLIEKEI